MKNHIRLNKGPVEGFLKLISSHENEISFYVVLVLEGWIFKMNCG